MRILWLSHLVPYPPKGGVTQRSYNLIKEVARENELIFVGLNQKAILPTEKELEEACADMSNFCREVHTLDFESHGSRAGWYWLVVRSLFGVHGYKVNWTRSKEMHRVVKRVMSENQVDLVHFDTISLAEYAGDVGALPKVMNHHNIESHMMLRRAKNEKHPLKKVYFGLEGMKLSKYEKQRCSEFDCNLVVSELDGKRLSEAIRDLEICVIANGVDVDYFRIKQKVRKGTLIFAGGMSWYPNRNAILFFFEEIWPILKTEIGGLTFFLIGQNPPQSIVDLGKQDHSIRVLGWVDDVRPYFERAEVVVCPIRDGGGTRLKILDNLAMEKAVVSTTLGAEGIEVTPEKNILIADSPGDFVKQIKRVIGDDRLRERLGREGRVLVENLYSWKKIGESLKAVYRESVASKNYRGA